MQETESQVKGPSYDPSKKYKWENETGFYFTGQEFGMLLNSIRGILNTPEAKKIFLAQQANLAIENSLARAVEMGLVKEDSLESPKKGL